MSLSLEQKACVEGYDFASLRQFIRLFPSLPLTKMLRVYFLYIGAPLPKEDDNEDDGEPSEINPDDDPFDIILVR